MNECSKAYLTEKNVAEILNSFVADLVSEQPDDVVEYLAEWSDKRCCAQQKIVQGHQTGDSQVATIFEKNKLWAASVAHNDPAFFSESAKGQKPKYLFLGCSDSRVPLNQICGCGPGELFVHRNIANLVHCTDLSWLSCLSYAVEHLAVEHVVVCGHTFCGGVTAAYNDAKAGIVNNWICGVGEVQARHRESLEKVPEANRLAALIEINAIQQVANVAATTCVVDWWMAGKTFDVRGWMYGLEDGRLRSVVTLDKSMNHQEVIEAAIAAVVERLQ